MKAWIPACAGMTEGAPSINVARRGRLVQESAALALRERLEVIAKMLAGLINGLGKRDI